MFDYNERCSEALLYLESDIHPWCDASVTLFRTSNPYERPQRNPRKMRKGRVGISAEQEGLLCGTKLEGGTKLKGKLTCFGGTKLDLPEAAETAGQST